MSAFKPKHRSVAGVNGQKLGLDVSRDPVDFDIAVVESKNDACAWIRLICNNDSDLPSLSTNYRGQ